ncbi:MAG: hypothetical protein AAFR76_14545 [Planctomycetota bacterium]
MNDRVSILHLGEGESRQAWKEALAGRPWDRGTLIKRDGRRAVHRAGVNGLKVSLKSRPLERSRFRFRLTEYARATRAARLIGKHEDVATPPVLFHGAVDDLEILVHPWIEGPTLLDRMCASDSEERGAWLRHGASRVTMMLFRGIVNRDMKPSNIVVPSGDETSMTMIDVGGVRRFELLRGDRWPRWAARMLTALVFEPRGVGLHIPDEQVLSCVPVMVECGFSGFVDARRRGQRRRLLASTNQEVQRLLGSHGDAKPKINPLEPPRP